LWEKESGGLRRKWAVALPVVQLERGKRFKAVMRSPVSLAAY